MAKFIVPATYSSHNGHDKDGKPIIEQLPYEDAGKVVEVPDADAEHFEKELGWKKAPNK